MELAVSVTLVLITVVGAAALLVGVPFAFGLMAYDAVQSRKGAPAAAVITEDAGVSIAVKRGIARAFVVAGAAFWSFATYAEVYSLGNANAGRAALMALVPLAGSLATLVIGWYWERLTSVALMVAAFGIIAYGVIYGYTAEMWMIMTISLIGPMFTSSVLFWLARSEQEAYERETASAPELAFAFAARSTIS